MAETREELVSMAKVAKEAERYDEMVEAMEKAVAALPEGEELTAEERKLLSVAYKNAISSRKASWRITSVREQNAMWRRDADRVTANRDHRVKLESELTSICEGILRLLNARLVPSATADDSKVFFLTMKGDYYRHLAEFKTGALRNDAVDSALSAYRVAQAIAAEKLAPTHPFRLALALSFSEFQFAIMRLPKIACTLAEQAFDQAIAVLDALGEEPCKDSSLIMQHLRDNIMRWNAWR